MNQNVGVEEQFKLAQVVIRLLTRKIRQENLYKQKSFQSVVPYFWGVTFQFLKQHVAFLPGELLKRVVKALEAEEGAFHEWSDLCFTQVCLQQKKIEDLPEKLWGGCTIYDYMLGILDVPTCGGNNGVELLRKCFSSDTYCEAAAKKFDLEKFTDKKFMEQWGSEHKAWPIQKKLQSRLGFPLPGSMIAAHREYYLLPKKLPDSAQTKWGGFRLLVSKVTIAECFADDSLAKGSKVATQEVHFLYYTDSHYGDDGTYDGLNLPDHRGEKPYYLLGILELLLLRAKCEKGLILGMRFEAIKTSAICFMERMLLSLDKHEEVYPHVCEAILYDLLGVDENALDTIFGSSIYSAWLKRACKSGRVLSTKLLGGMLEVSSLISESVCPLCMKVIGDQEYERHESKEDGTVSFVHKDCWNKL